MTQFSFLKPALTGCLISVAPLAAPLAAMAHASLETQTAALGTTYKGVMRITHGCDGHSTQRVRIDIPEGVVNVKPMPKPGWTVTTERGAYAHSYTVHGSPVTEGVQAIEWSGGTLPDDFFDEFIFRGTLDDSLGEGVIYFPTTQYCADGENAWVDIPASADAPRPASPAPALDLVAPAHADHTGH